MGSFGTIEELIFEGMLSIVGDPIFIGVFVLVFIGSFALVQGLRLDGKLLGITGAAMLAAAFIPGFIVLLMFAFAYVVYKGLMKVIGK